MKFNLKDITKIFIIESPSEKDLLEGRQEGIALSETLKLARIQNDCFTVKNKSGLIDILGKIVAEIKIDQKKWGAISIHFSLHGK